MRTRTNTNASMTKATADPIAQLTFEKVCFGTSTARVWRFGFPRIHGETKAPNAQIAVISNAIVVPGRLRGSVTVKNALVGDAPIPFAASTKE